MKRANVTKPNPDNCMKYSSVLLIMTVHNTTQDSYDNLHSYLQTNIIALRMHKTDNKLISNCIP